MKALSQYDKILNYLADECGGITQMEAAEKFNIWRLSSIIYRARYDYGENIKTVWEQGKKGHRWARYFLLTGTEYKCPCCMEEFDRGEAQDITSDGFHELIMCPKCDTEFDPDDPYGEEPSYDEWIAELNKGYDRDRL